MMIKKHTKIIIYVLIGVVLVSYFLKPVSIALLIFNNPEKTSMMKYRENQAEKKGKKYNLKYKWVASDRISPFLKKAVILGEDEKFWSHIGFDLEGIKYAFDTNIKKRHIVRGGSTISQQLAKNLFLKPRKSLWRKFREAVLTLELELILSKGRILELYLNVVEWGDGIFGAEAAAKHYYGEAASRLTLDESIRLVAVLPNPLRYSPVRESRFVAKRAEVLYEKFYHNNGVRAN